MWNYKIKRGAIWTVKSQNNFDEYYTGMSYGYNEVLILSTYIDENNIEKFTYVNIDQKVKSNFSNYYNLVINKRVFNINLDSINTGDRRALDYFVGQVSDNDLLYILGLLKSYFNIFEKPRKLAKKIEKVDTTKKTLRSEITSQLIKNAVNQINKNSTLAKDNLDKQIKELNKRETPEEEKFIKIHKYNIDITFIPCNHISLSKTGRIIISDELKDDILNCPDTDLVSKKYNIFPERAIREMKSRLKYRQNH